MEESWHPNHKSLAWGHSSQNFGIVNTYLKLTPDSLLSLWSIKQNSSSYPRSRIRELALSMLPGLGLTRQTLSTSLDYVLRERSVMDLYDRAVAYEFAQQLDLELSSWMCWGPPTARLKYGGILDQAGAEESSGRGEDEEGQGRYGRDCVRSGRKPDYGSFGMEHAVWVPPRAGWTMGPGGAIPGLPTLKGDDGGCFFREGVFFY